MAEIMNHGRRAVTEPAIDAMEPDALRAYARHMSALVERLLTERESHLRRVETAFRSRHNRQQAEIETLRRKLAKEAQACRA